MIAYLFFYYFFKMNFSKSIFVFLFFINSIGIAVGQTKEDAKNWLTQLKEKPSNSIIAANNVWQQWQDKDISYCKNALLLLKTTNIIYPLFLYLSQQ